MRICQIWRKLIRDGSEQEPATGRRLAKEGVRDEVTKIVASHDPEMTEVGCNDGHDVLRSLLPQMSETLFICSLEHGKEGKQCCPWRPIRWCDSIKERRQEAKAQRSKNM